MEYGNNYQQYVHQITPWSHTENGFTDGDHDRFLYVVTDAEASGTNQETN
jgi:hypothetical protein